ncbi:MAG: demethoxyubiquinone hydroxylase family protein [Bacteroidota bacterium]
MAAAIDIKKRTEFFIRDLHARENMRLGWYRQFGIGDDSIRYLRAQKATHAAFLRDLLRKRGVSPAWYARFFYLIGHLFGFLSALLPQKNMEHIKDTLESWMLIRYQRYFKEMTLDATLRSMIESLQMKRLAHSEPGQDALNLIQNYIDEQSGPTEPEEKSISTPEPTMA